MITQIQKVYDPSTGARLTSPLAGIIQMVSPVTGTIKEIRLYGIVGGSGTVLFNVRVNNVPIWSGGSRPGMTSASEEVIKASLSTAVTLGQKIRVDVEDTGGFGVTPPITVVVIVDTPDFSLDLSTPPADQQLLKYDNASSKWLPGPAVSTDGTLASNSDVKLPSEKAVKTFAEAKRDEAKSYADGLVTGLFDDRGNYDASGNTFPSSGGSGTAGAILKGDIWRISVAGTLGAIAVAVGDWVRALVDTPGSTEANWSINQSGGGGASALADLTDVDLTGIADEDILVWDAGTSTWLPAAPSGGDPTMGGDISGLSSAAIVQGFRGRLIEDIPLPENYGDTFDGVSLDSGEWELKQDTGYYWITLTQASGKWRFACANNNYGKTAIVLGLRTINGTDKQIEFGIGTYTAPSNDTSFFFGLLGPENTLSTPSYSQTNRVGFVCDRYGLYLCTFTQTGNGNNNTTITPSATGAVDRLRLRDSGGIMHWDAIFTANPSTWVEVATLNYTLGALLDSTIGVTVTMGQYTSSILDVTEIVTDYALADTLADGSILAWDAGDVQWKAATPSTSPSSGTVTYTTASIANNAEEATSDVTIAKGFTAMRVVADRPCRVRLYASQAYRTADSARAFSTAPTGEHGVILDLDIVTGNLTIDLSPAATGFCLESTRDTGIPIAVQNKSGSTSTVAVTISFVAIEV